MVCARHPHGHIVHQDYVKLSNMKEAAARLTPAGAMVLALLAEGDMHPYEMKRRMKARHDDRLVTITNGTLYRTVAGLEQQNLLAEVGVDRGGNRPERTTYSLTAAGRDALVARVHRALARVDRPAEFCVALAEAHHLERADVIDLLRQRRAALADAHARHRGRRAEALDKGVPEQFLLEVEREELLLAAELGWLDGLIDRLDAETFGWGVDAHGTSERHLEQRKAARL